MKEGISCLKHEQVAAKENIKPEQQPQQNPWKLKKNRLWKQKFNNPGAELEEWAEEVNQKVLQKNKKRSKDQKKSHVALIL